MSVTKFKSAWWLSNSHLQTIFPVLFPRKIKLDTRRERIELPDSDFIDLDWVGENSQDIVLVLHGLAGSIKSPYAQGILRTITTNGWQGVFMHFRGCSGEPNRLLRSYHSGETQDLSFIINTIRTRFPNSKLAVIGYSLGGNVLLKWLGEKGITELIKCAVAISVPFDLSDAVNRMQKGFSKVYQWRLLRDLRAEVLKKAGKVLLPISASQILRLKNFKAFDQTITAPFHGFKDADEYYALSSSKQYLENIQVPTLILHSLDDPFMSKDSIPTNHELSESITFELSRSGGHVGFISGKNPFKPKYWLEERIPLYLKTIFETQELKV